jgi:hypothetical protein
MQARSLPKTFDDPPPDEGRSSGDEASKPSEFSDRNDRLTSFGRRIDAYREWVRLADKRLSRVGPSFGPLGMPVPRDDLRGFDRALRLLSLGDGTCGDVSPEPGPDSPDQPSAA